MRCSSSPRLTDNGFVQRSTDTVYQYHRLPLAAHSSLRTLQVKVSIIPGSSRTPQGSAWTAFRPYLGPLFAWDTTQLAPLPHSMWAWPQTVDAECGCCGCSAGLAFVVASVPCRTTHACYMHVSHSNWGRANLNGEHAYVSTRRVVPPAHLSGMDCMGLHVTRLPRRCASYAVAETPRRWMALRHTATHVRRRACMKT